MTLDAETSAVLVAAGWTRERQVDVTGWIRSLGSEGYTFSPTAIAAVTNLGGLVVPAPRATDRQSFAPYGFRFDPILMSGEYGRVRRWEERLGTALSPLGEITGPSYLLVSPTGATYSLYHNELHWWGDSLPAALRALLLTTDWPRPVRDDGTLGELVTGTARAH